MENQTTESSPSAPPPCSARRELRKIMDVNRALKSDAKHRTDLVKIKGALETLARQIEDSVRVEYTGDFVLLKKSDDGWAFVAIYNPDTWEGDDPEWDQCMPIPKLETVPEFDGW